VAISRLVDRVGQVLGGRYRLIAPIGTGASASVYLADDVTLRRRVAVKILHDALADDAAFLKRFHAEARAAAALNHPHIMAVYDWGQGDVPYLVTEYLGGGSLRSMLDLGRRLTAAQTLLVGIEAARGLEYAHRRGFVHRDIKPANLLFDEDARLRIADFGLARALAEAAWTEPMGAVLGTARYASPEQARGTSLDGKSDVYSLSLTLIEATTGDVPFSADTTLGTLMARIERPVPVPESLAALRVPLEAAGRPDPASRPDAAEFAALLMDAAKDLDRPETLPLAGAMANETIVLDDRDPTTQFISERALVADTEPDIMRAPPGTTTDGITIIEEGDGQPAVRTIDRQGPVADEPSGPSRRARRAAKKARRADRRAIDRMARGGKRRRWPWILVAVLVVGGAATGGFTYWYENIRIATYTVPSFVGQNEAAIAPLLEEGGWTTDVTQTRVDGTEPGQILEQNPAADTQLEEGGVVALVVSLGPTLVALPPDLVNKTVEEASAALTAAGFVVGEQTPQYSEEVAQGVVLQVGPDLLPEMPKGSTIPLVVSAGPAPRTIPDLGGLTVDQARQRIEALQLNVTTQNRESDAPEGSLLGSNPASGQQVARGSTVTLLVAVPPTVVVPSVAGRTAADAATVLQQAGLQVSGTQGSPANPVRGTDPASGTTVRRGTAVAIITG
jgi:serine/threonine-protein kinase